MKPLGLYLHWPYCAKICPYCDFTVAKARAIDEEAWAEVLLDDLRVFSELTEKRALASIYFGGGTPSLMPPRVAEQVLGAAEELFGIEDGAELTVEANPDDLERFGDLRALGFNRLSLGVQSLDDAELQFLGRNHDGREARQAIERAQSVFEQASLDFIYALPDQAPGEWEAKLEDILALGAPHLSLYQLTIEPDTAFGKRAERGQLIPAPDGRMAELYRITQTMTGAAGTPAYEISNHARPGFEARHNGLYWDEAEWIGVGPGAHGRLEKGGVRRATLGLPKPSVYVRTSRNERIETEVLTAGDILVETIASGLRPKAGLDLARLGPAREAVSREAEPLISDGLLRVSGGRLQATEEGALVLDAITSVLVSSLSASRA